MSTHRFVWYPFVAVEESGTVTLGVRPEGSGFCQADDLGVVKKWLESELRSLGYEETQGCAVRYERNEKPPRGIIPWLLDRTRVVEVVVHSRPERVLCGP